MQKHGALRIKDWSLRYEVNRTKEIRNLRWLPLPNNLDSDLYCELVDHPLGAAHFGVWIGLLIVASRCEPRGELRRDGGAPHTAASLARILRMPIDVLEGALERLLDIGLLEVARQEPAISPQDAATLPHFPAVIPHPAATSPQDAAQEERRGEETEERRARACGAASGLPVDEFFEQRYRAHPKKRDRMLAEQYMSQIPGIETAETQDEFRRGHDAWIRSEEWRWKNGAKAPTFAQFILDKSWEYPPPPDEEDSGEVPMISTEEFERLHPPSSEGVDPYAEWIPPWEDEKRKRKLAAGGGGERTTRGRAMQ